MLTPLLAALVVSLIATDSSYGYRSLTQVRAAQL
jgi:hypothetical protein